MKIRTLSLGVIVIACLAAASCGNRNAPTTVTLGGAQVAADRSVTLTAAKPDQAGGLFRRGAIELNAFSSEIQFQISDARDSADQCEGKRPGGEGLAFVLLGTEPRKLGSSGSGLGYQGLTDSIAIEFDTACSSGTGDPARPHVAINRDGSVSHEQGSLGKPATIVDERSGTSFDDAALWTAWIDYADGIMEVRIARGSKRPEQASLRAEVPAKQIESRPLSLGLTAATGKGYSKQTIVGWKLDWVSVPKGSVPPKPPLPKKTELLVVSRR